MRLERPWLTMTEGPLGNWLRGLSARAHRNTVIVALANKLARIAWAVLRSTAIYNATTSDWPTVALTGLVAAPARGPVVPKSAGGDSEMA